MTEFMEWKDTSEGSEKTFIQKTLSFAKALLTGQDVSQDRLEKRLEVCAQCDLVNLSESGTMTCGICGCRLKEKGLQNLARYEETPEYGCKHPRGSQWKKNGV